LIRVDGLTEHAAYGAIDRTPSGVIRTGRSGARKATSFRMIGPVSPLRCVQRRRIARHRHLVSRMSDRNVLYGVLPMTSLQCNETPKNIEACGAVGVGPLAVGQRENHS
jgi:hypothetical protein